jgi:peptide/nickel transport system substrate-binding protein
VPFTQPFVYFLQGLCSAPSIVKAGTTAYDAPVGTGPFKFESFATNQQTVMVRNPDYWIPERPYLDGATMILFDDATSQINAMLGGQVDAIGALDPTIAKTHENDPGLVLFQSPSSLASYFYMRVDTPPFTDNQVREAFKLAVDREQLVQNILLGYGSVGNDLPGKGYADYNSSIPQRTYDPEKAKSLLKQAGQEGLSVTGLTYPDRAPEFAAYQQQAKAAGIDIKLKSVPLAQYYADPYWPEPPTGFAQTRWPGTFAYFAQNTLLSNSPFPETGWKDAAWDAGFAKAVATIDDTARNEQMMALEQTIWEQGGLIAWGYANFLDMLTDKVQGLQTGPDRNLGFYNLKNVWLSK